MKIYCHVEDEILSKFLIFLYFYYIILGSIGENEACHVPRVCPGSSVQCVYQPERVQGSPASKPGGGEADPAACVPLVPDREPVFSSGSLQRLYL